jgi:hypothetical protein
LTWYMLNKYWVSYKEMKNQFHQKKLQTLHLTNTDTKYNYFDLTQGKI